MTETEQRAAVVAEARSWLGTPYHHYGKLKGIGTDCSQMPIKVYAACGLFEDFDTGAYLSDWHLHKAEERYLKFVYAKARREITEAAIGPGDFIVFRLGRCFSHGAIVTDYPRLIHAAYNQGVIMDDAGTNVLGRKPRKYFTFWE